MQCLPGSVRFGERPVCGQIRGVQKLVRRLHSHPRPWQGTGVSLKDRSQRPAQLPLQRSWLRSPESGQVPGTVCRQTRVTNHQGSLCLATSGTGPSRADLRGGTARAHL